MIVNPVASFIPGNQASQLGREDDMLIASIAGLIRGLCLRFVARLRNRRSHARTRHELRALTPHLRDDLGWPGRDRIEQHPDTPRNIS